MNLNKRALILLSVLLILFSSFIIFKKQKPVFYIIGDSRKEIVLVSKLCEGAFDALMSGDSATHDKKVGDALNSYQMR